MRAKHVNLLLASVAFTLFSFACFCISRLTQTSNQLTNCRNHILEFKENTLRFKNKSETIRQELMKVLNQVKYNITREDLLGNSVEKKVDTWNENETVVNRFEDLKFFLPHLKKVKRIYPNVVLGKGKMGVSFALGIPTVSRGNHSYLKQTLTSVVTRMTHWEEKDSVVIVSVADNSEDYLHSVVDMVTKRFKRQVKSGSLEVISVPDFFYPNLSHAKQSTEDSKSIERWRIKQVLDYCILMLYAQPKATYYLQLEDDIIAKEMYLTKIRDFLGNITSNDWFYIEFSVLGFIGKLFRSKDLPDFVQFFLMFYKDKPIDLLLDDIFRVKLCDSVETFAARIPDPRKQRRAGRHARAPEPRQVRAPRAPAARPSPSAAARACAVGSRRGAAAGGLGLADVGAGGSESEPCAASPEEARPQEGVGAAGRSRCLCAPTAVRSPVAAPPRRGPGRASPAGTERRPRVGLGWRVGLRERVRRRGCADGSAGRGVLRTAPAALAGALRREARPLPAGARGKGAGGGSGGRGGGPAPSRAQAGEPFPPTPSAAPRGARLAAGDGARVAVESSEALITGDSLSPKTCLL
ncbi:alpha-1,3-mannosyl-glycoprotein 4-beta-N-acetylglucosaminyltransferase-like protein MGAT4D [Ctenodactylus gundi]